VSDASPGIRRRRSGRGFRYFDTRDHPITETRTLARIRKLAIPPAWRSVWICPSPNGHIQATGRDARGRKQYRYHDRWRQVRDAVKYDRLVAFGRALPALRERVEADLSLPGLPREKVLAAIVRLLDSRAIRIGNDAYARQNGSFGLTTLQDDHAEISGTEISLQFRGKGGKDHVMSIRDRRLARIVRRCQDLPGQILFQYLDAHGEPRSVRSDDVNEYLKAATGQEFTAKDFRTWAGTLFAAQALFTYSPPAGESDARRKIVAAIKDAAERLGNTPAVCRKCYVHPAVFEAYARGELARLTDASKNGRGRVPERAAQFGEQDLIALLERRLLSDEG
jgi:DNA topoisomerase-1